MFIASLNVIKLLTPKSNTGWIYNDFSIRQAFEKINHYGYKAMPIVDSYGYYKGVISTDDILNYIREKQIIDDKSLEKYYISSISHIWSVKALNCNASEEEVIDRINDCNFVPLIDDRGAYIGIITRKSVINELYKKTKI